MVRSVRSCASAALAAGLLAACGHGTTLTAGTPTPAPPYVPHVSSSYAAVSKNALPLGIALGTDGNIWFTEFKASKIGQLNHKPSITENKTPSSNAQPNGISTGPNNGLMWFTETALGKVAEFSLNSPPVITEFPLTVASGPAPRPANISLGSDGNMWVTDPGTDSIWKVDQKGNATQYKVSPGADPTSITTGPDGANWFVEPGLDKIGRLPIAGSPLTEYPVGAHHARLTSIAAATDGGLWFIEQAEAEIVRMSVTGVVTAEYSLSPAKQPNQLLQGVDGNFYFTDTQGNNIGRFLYSSQKVNLYSIPTANSKPTNMVLGPDNQIYFTEPGADALGQFKYFCC